MDMGVTFEQTWRAMEGLVDAGHVRQIGLANVKVTTVCDVMKYARIKPTVVQVELNPYLTQKHFVEFTQSLGIQVMAYSSFGSTGYVQMGMATANDSFMTHQALTGPATKYGKSPQQVSLRWAIQRGTVVIPKTQNAGRLTENIDLFDFALTASEMEQIDSLDKNLRFCCPTNFGMKSLPPVFH